MAFIKLVSANNIILQIQLMVQFCVIVYMLQSIDLILVIGIAAGTLTAISMLPQVFKTIKTKKAENVSPLMLIVLIVGVALWAVYGIIKNDLPIIITNCFSLLVSICMLFLRWKYSSKSKKSVSQ